MYKRQVRLSIYRRLSNLKSKKDIEDFNFELIDRFGKLPKQVISLLDLINIKQVCKQTNISSLEVGNNGVSICFYQNNFSNAEGLIAYISNHPNLIQLRPLFLMPKKLRVSIGFLYLSLATFFLLLLKFSTEFFSY